MTEDQLSPFIVQCDENGDRQTYARPVWHETLCGFCAKPVTFADFLVVVSDNERSISYPFDNARAFLTHSDCGPGVGYYIDLGSLAKKHGDLYNGVHSAEAWISHLQSKDWFHIGIVYAIDHAHELAARLQKELRSEASEPVQSTPRVRSIPRTPDPTRNPRAISLGTRTRVMERDGFRCRRCGCGPKDEKLVVDHVIPVAKGGSGDESNLQILCYPCNAGKSDRDPHAHDLARDT